LLLLPLLPLLLLSTEAEELSVPGDYNQVMNGINPW
jgi:hypothetical protein